MKPNWAAMNYVKRLTRETGINGNLRFIMMMIASRIPRSCIETLPTSLGFLQKTTGNSKKTVQNLRDKLVAKQAIEVGEAGGGRGKFQTYRIPALAGPLFMVPDSTPNGVSLTSFSPHRNEVSLTPFVGETVQSAPPDGTPSPSFFEDVRTRERSTTTARKPVAAELYAMALEYLDWFGATYPQHHHGAGITLDIEADGPIVVDLLTKPPRRTIAQLHAMAIAMWTATTREDPWLARATDRGLKLLKHAADRLDRIAAARAAAVAQEPHQPRHDPATVIDRAIRCLEAQADPVLRAACQEAGIVLRGPAPDVGALQARLLGAARERFDVTAIEREADAELAPFKTRMHSAAFEQSRRACVDRLLRERAALPDLLELAELLARRREASA